MVDFHIVDAAFPQLKRQRCLKEVVTQRFSIHLKLKVVILTCLLLTCSNMEECIDFVLLLFWSILSIVECAIYNHYIVV